VLATVLGCAGGTNAFVTATRTRARTALECPTTRIAVTPLGGGGYLAAGCGRRQSYTCAVNNTGWTRDVVCVPDGAPSADERVSRADAETAAIVASAGGDSSARTERAARAAVDAVADAVLACTGGTAAAVVVDWTATGRLTFHLSGASASTAADGCVRVLSPAAPLDPPPGSAGSVLHPVH
jgi:hypothetical protein